MVSIDAILDSPLMYAVVGIILTEYGEWKLKKWILPILKELLKEKLREGSKNEKEGSSS